MGAYISKSPHINWNMSLILPSVGIEISLKVPDSMLERVYVATAGLVIGRDEPHFQLFSDTQELSPPPFPQNPAILGRTL